MWVRLFWQCANIKQHLKKQTAEINRVWSFFCKLDFSMTKYRFLGRIAEFRLSCLNCNIARILRHVKGGLARDREFSPCTWWKICAKKAVRHTLICLVVMPLADIAMIFCSIADMSFLRFCTICGSKSLSQSCGTSIGISPYELRNFLCFTPFR